MEIKVALAGNPNSGKTTLFNILTGSNQFVGNWPGVTVEKKEGKLKGYEGVIITDLPGVYSLSPYTLEEVVTRNYMLNENPQVILNVIDGTNIERNLYLTTQLLELGLPVVVALNMVDVIRKNGDKIDIKELEKRLRTTVIEISALKGTGIEELKQAVVEKANETAHKTTHYFSGTVEHAIAHIEEAVLHNLPEEKQRFYAVKIFERDEKIIESLKISKEVLTHIEQDIKSAETELDDDAESIITNERYVHVAELLQGVYVKKNAGKLSTSDKIDKIVTNRFLALPIFAVVMFLVYFISVTTVGTLLNDFVIDGIFGDGFYIYKTEEKSIFIKGIPVLIESGLNAINCAEWLKGLILDGILAGVGSVLGFVPQMFVLFIFLAFLEACGYMSRIAFIMDKIFRKFGLSGKSFIPMLIGTGCGVPGIMASRTIESEQDRRMTIITTTFIPCGAKLPFIAMIAGAIFGGAWWVAPSAYFMGVVAVLLSGIVLKKTKLFAGEPAPFVMELPAYRLPTVKNVLTSMWERGWSFIKKAGTVILLSSVIVWFLTYFGFVNGKFTLLDESQFENSILAYMGKGISWLFIPCGFGTWQSTVATFTGLVAKENLVSTMSIMYGTSGSTVSNLSGVFTTASGYAFLAFNLLCAPCFAAMGAIKKEMNSGKWTFFAILYQCTVAYIVATVINQIGNIFIGKFNLVGFIVALLLIAFVVFMLVRKNNKKKVA